MPFLHRFRSPSPKATMETRGRTQAKSVGFAPLPLPSGSRHLTNPELWKLHDFEAHARVCPDCTDPYHCHKAGTRLCDQGQTLAQHVARIIYSKHSAKDVYDATLPRSSNPVRVQVPEDYVEVKSLLKAMERSLRHKTQEPIVSFGGPDYTPTRAQSTPRRSRHTARVESPELPKLSTSPGTVSPPSARRHKHKREKPVVLPRVPLTYTNASTGWRDPTPGLSTTSRALGESLDPAAPLLRTHYPSRSRSVSSSGATTGSPIRSRPVESSKDDAPVSPSPQPRVRSHSSTAATAGSPDRSSQDSAPHRRRSSTSKRTARPVSMYEQAPRWNSGAERRWSGNGSPPTLAARPVSMYVEPPRLQTYPPSSFPSAAVPISASQASSRRSSYQGQGYVTELREPKSNRRDSGVY